MTNWRYIPLTNEWINLDFYKYMRIESNNFYIVNEEQGRLLCYVGTSSDDATKYMFKFIRGEHV